MTLPAANNQHWEYVKIHPARFNLIDLVNFAARPAVPATLFYDIDVTWVENLRARFADAGKKVSITAFLLRAISLAQRKHPACRTVWLPNGKLIQINKIEGQFTVERYVDEQPALFFGAVKDSDTKPIVQIHDELHAYAKDPIAQIPQFDIEHKFSRYPWFIRQLIIFFGMRNPSIRLQYMGATFALSSLGKYGCRNLISPSVITSMFCIGEVADRPVAVDGKVEIHPILSLVLNFDHRVIDGAVAARFVTDVIKMLQGEMLPHLEDELKELGINETNLSEKSLKPEAEKASRK